MQRFFSDVAVYVDSLVDNNAYLNINIAERPGYLNGNTTELRKGNRPISKNVSGCAGVANYQNM